MKFELQIFDELFDNPLERITKIIDDYLSGLIEIKPEAVLRVEISEGRKGKIWKGYIEETKEWGKDEVVFGHIEIIPLFVNSATPMQVKLYCSHPNYMAYWVGLRDLLLKNLELSDGTPPPAKEPWLLIPDQGYDRQLVKMLHEGYKAKESAKRLSISPQRAYNRESELRKLHGEDIVPKRIDLRKSR